jgi:PAS domain S-box-containing protein
MLITINIAIFCASIVAFFFLSKLRIFLVNVGWGLFSLGLLVNVVSEISDNIILQLSESILMGAGMMIFALALIKECDVILNELKYFKDAEEALAEREELFRTLTENAIAGVFMIDENGTLIYVNPTFSRVFGYERDELVGRNTFDIIHPEDRKIVESRIRDRLKGRVDLPPSRFRIIKKDGSVRWVEAFGTSATYKGKKVVLGTLVDITERLKSEEEIKKAKERFETLVQNIPGVVFRRFLDDKWTIEYMSDESKNLFGLEPSELIGKSYLALIHPEDKENVMKDILKGESYRTEYRIANGKYVVERGRKINEHVDGVILDITRIKELEEERKKLEAQLAHAERLISIGQLAGGVAHEINNPLTVILNYAWILKDELPSDSEHYEMICEIEEAGMRIKKIVSDLLDFSRKGGGEFYELNINDIIEKTLTILTHELRTIKVEKRLDAKSSVLGEEEKIMQILLNIISNSIWALNQKET